MGIISWRRTDLGEVFHFNPTFRRILDLPADTLPGYSHLLTLVHREDAHLQREKNQLIATGASDSYILEERFVLSGDRLVWGRLAVAVIRDGNGRIVQEIGILRGHHRA